MSTIKVTNIEHESTGNGGIQLDNAGHVTVDGQQMPTAGALSNRNMIINGDMRIDQRNGGSSTTPTADQTYVFDRWMIRNAGGPGRFSVESSSVSPNSIDPSMLLTVTTTDAPAANEFYAVEQRVEGYLTAPSAFGSSDAKALTLSFWVRSSLTGTYCCSFRNSAANRSFVAEYSISAANTWEFKTIQIEAKTDGTWNTTNSIGGSVDWVLGSGSNFEGSTGWQSANRLATSNQVDWINSSGATFHLTGVQLEVGEKATPFEHRSYGDELARCYRYCQRYGGGRIAMGIWTNGATGDHALINHHLHTPMRTTPAIEAVTNGNLLVEAVAWYGVTSTPTIQGESNPRMAVFTVVTGTTGAVTSDGQTPAVWGNGADVTLEAEL